MLWRCGRSILLWKMCQIRYDVVFDRFYIYYGRWVRYIMTLWFVDSILIMGAVSDTLWRYGWPILYLLWDMSQIHDDVVADWFYMYYGSCVRYVMTLWLIDSVMGDESNALWRCGWSILLWEMSQIRYDVVVDRFCYGRWVKYVMTLWLIDSVMGDESNTLWRCGWSILLWEMSQIRYDVVVDWLCYGRWVKYVMTSWLIDCVMGDESNTLWRCGWSILYLLLEMSQIHNDVLIGRFYTYYGRYVSYVIML